MKEKGEVNIRYSLFLPHWDTPSFALRRGNDHYDNYTTYSFTTGEYNVLANDDDSGAKDDGSGYVEVGTQTTVLVYARAWDDRPGEASGNVGCGEDGQRGCMPALTRDGDTMDEESRWSCAKKISYDQCWITFAFEEPQYVHDMEVYLWKGDERKRTLKVSHRRYRGAVIQKC